MHFQWKPEPLKHTSVLVWSLILDGKIVVIGGTPAVPNDGALNIYDHNGVIVGQEAAVFTADCW